MAIQLTKADLTILSNFAAQGNHYGYWTNLVNLGDPYAKLALGVVTNGTLEGYIANSYTEDHAAFRKMPWTPENAQELGIDIMNRDLKCETRSI